MHHLLAFLDESGNSNLDTTLEGISTHFIVTAVIIDESVLPRLESGLNEISHKFFSNSEIKSSNVGSDDGRRLRILKDLVKLDFKQYSSVVDKRLLLSKGFEYKGSFFKFLHSLVDRELFRVFPNLKITADEHGYKEFMDGFIKYIEDRHIPSLFDQSEFRFVKSKSARMIQCADFVCGTIARCFDEKIRSPKAVEYLKLLKEKTVSIVEWPPQKIPFLPELGPGQEGVAYDKNISELCVNLVEQYISDHQFATIPAEVDQVKFLRLLLLHYRHIDATKYVSSHEVLKNLGVSEYGASKLHYIRSKIIAPLRDSRVIISSSSNGYKIPLNKKDIYDYIAHANVRIGPQLHRVKLCRESVKLATLGNFDVLDFQEFQYLKVFFDKHLLSEEN